jgi:hypothetical protein
VSTQSTNVLSGQQSPPPEPETKYIFTKAELVAFLEQALKSYEEGRATCEQ